MNLRNSVPDHESAAALRADHELPVPAGSWAYDLWGHHGRPLVLIPAILFDRTSWWPAAADLRPHATVVAVDLPGHGDSAARDRYDPDELVDDLAEIVAGLRSSRAPVVVGHGASAALAVHFAARYATHAVVSVDVPDHRPADADEYLAGMHLDALPDRYRDLARPAADPHLLTGYARCLDLAAAPAVTGTARLAVHSRPPSAPAPGWPARVYDVPGRFAHLAGLSRFIDDIRGLL
jgi:pimeloyl-ACP methyl ester carboxylesterase